jgi:hypothetical protein
VTDLAPSVGGSAVWDLLAAFFASRRSFLAVYRRYEDRVHRFARDAGVHRDDLVLPPADLARLFNPKRLQRLRDQRIEPLRRLAHSLFRESGVVEPLDTLCSHVFHELSILMEEHQSVVRFPRLSDPKRYEQLFEEVRGYYPVRLRRIRRLFADGLKRVEELLPGWSHDRVVVRSVYLFGRPLARSAYEDGLDGLYARMYPAGGAAEGYLVAARSFADSAFPRHAREAAERSVAAAKAAGGVLASAEGARAARRGAPSRAAAQARRLIRDLDAAEAGEGADGPPRGQAS